MVVKVKLGFIVLGWGGGDFVNNTRFTAMCSFLLLYFKRGYSEEVSAEH